MSLSNENWNYIIVIIALFLGLLGFSKDIAEKNPRMGFLDNLYFKIFFALLLTYTGWYASSQKDKNSDKEKAAVHAKDDAVRKRFDTVLVRQHKTDSITLFHANKKIDSLRDTLEKKQDLVINAQNRTIREIQGGDLPWVQANVVPQPGAPLLNLSITDLRKIPTNDVLVDFVDMIAYFTVAFPKNGPGGTNAEWEFEIQKSFPALTPGKEYFFYQKSIDGFAGDHAAYEINVSWRGGTYTYGFVIKKENGSFNVSYEEFTYNKKKYDRAAFIDKFFPKPDRR